MLQEQSMISGIADPSGAASTWRAYYSGRLTNLFTKSSTSAEYRLMGNQIKNNNSYNYKKQVVTGIHGTPFDQQTDDNYWQSKQMLPNINRPLGSGINNAAIINEGIYNINPIAGSNDFSGGVVSRASGLNPTNYSLVNTTDIVDRLRANTVPSDNPMSAQYAKNLTAGAQLDPKNIEGDQMLNTFANDNSNARNAKTQVLDTNLYQSGEAYNNPDDPAFQAVLAGRKHIEHFKKILENLPANDAIQRRMENNRREILDNLRRDYANRNNMDESVAEEEEEPEDMSMSSVTEASGITSETATSNGSSTTASSNTTDTSSGSSGYGGGLDYVGGGSSSGGSNRSSSRSSGGSSRSLNSGGSRGLTGEQDMPAYNNPLFEYGKDMPAHAGMTGGGSSSSVSRNASQLTNGVDIHPMLNTKQTPSEVSINTSDNLYGPGGAVAEVMSQEAAIIVANMGVAITAESMQSRNRLDQLNKLEEKNAAVSALRFVSGKEPVRVENAPLQSVPETRSMLDVAGMDLEGEGQMRPSDIRVGVRTMPPPDERVIDPRYMDPVEDPTFGPLSSYLSSTAVDSGVQAYINATLDRESHLNMTYAEQNELMINTARHILQNAGAIVSAVGEQARKTMDNAPETGAALATAARIVKEKLDEAPVTNRKLPKAMKSAIEKKPKLKSSDVVVGSVGAVSSTKGGGIAPNISISEVVTAPPTSIDNVGNKKQIASINAASKPSPVLESIISPVDDALDELFNRAAEKLLAEKASKKGKAKMKAYVPSDSSSSGDSYMKGLDRQSRRGNNIRSSSGGQTFSNSNNISNSGTLIQHTPHIDLNGAQAAHFYGGNHIHYHSKSSHSQSNSNNNMSLGNSERRIAIMDVPSTTGKRNRAIEDSGRADLNPMSGNSGGFLMLTNGDEEEDFGEKRSRTGGNALEAIAPPSRIQRESDDTGLKPTLRSGKISGVKKPLGLSKSAGNSNAKPKSRKLGGDFNLQDDLYDNGLSLVEAPSIFTPVNSNESVSNQLQTENNETSVVDGIAEASETLYDELIGVGRNMLEHATRGIHSASSAVGSSVAALLGPGTDADDISTNSDLYSAYTVGGNAHKRSNLYAARKSSIPTNKTLRVAVTGMKEETIQALPTLEYLVYQRNAQFFVDALKEFGKYVAKIYTNDMSTKERRMAANMVVEKHLLTQLVVLAPHLASADVPMSEAVYMFVDMADLVKKAYPGRRIGRVKVSSVSEPYGSEVEVTFKKSGMQGSLFQRRGEYSSDYKKPYRGGGSA